MSRLSGKAWQSLLQAHHQSRAVERRGLRHIHDHETLDELSIHLASHLAALNIRAVVRTESVWVDGTPQAIVTTGTGEVQCELADLLLLLTETRNKLVQRRSAVLIQAKVGTEIDKIPNGSSTTKERALLEEMDHSKGIALYRDTQAKAKINSYKLRSGGIGLEDYARYMVMPTHFRSTFFQSFEPFVTGWPPKTSSNLLSSLALFKDLPCALWDGTAGTSLDACDSSEWTRLVEDLLGKYRSKRMERFGGFDRIAKSSEHASLMFHTTQMLLEHRWTPEFYRSDASGDPPDNFMLANSISEQDGPAALPIISFVVDLIDED